MSEIKGRPITSIEDMPERGVYLITGQGGWKACKILNQYGRIYIQYFRDVDKAQKDFNWDIMVPPDWSEDRRTGWFHHHQDGEIFLGGTPSTFASLVLISDEDEGIEL